jgi:hypothetical protein
MVPISASGWGRSLLQAPEIVALYALNISPSMIRIKIRQEFEKNKAVTDVNIINMLLHKNQQEYQETMNCWKQEVSTCIRVEELGVRRSSRRRFSLLRWSSVHCADS